jgi:hypothetical protein
MKTLKKYSLVKSSKLPSSRLIPFLHSPTSGQPTARVARYSISQSCIPYRATLAFSHRTPTRRKSGVRLPPSAKHHARPSQHIFCKCYLFKGQKISHAALRVAIASLSCCLQLSCHPHGSLLCLLM